MCEKIELLFRPGKLMESNGLRTSIIFLLVIYFDEKLEKKQAQHDSEYFLFVSISASSGALCLI